MNLSMRGPSRGMCWYLVALVLAMGMTAASQE